MFLVWLGFQVPERGGVFRPPGREGGVSRPGASNFLCEQKVTKNSLGETPKTPAVELPIKLILSAAESENLRASDLYRVSTLTSAAAPAALRKYAGGIFLA